MTHRVHIFGASGSGTTTLAKALADARGWNHIDTDDIYWLPTVPPFRVSRNLDVRQELLRKAVVRAEYWTLSGSLCGWGDLAIPHFDLVVFLWIPADVRLARLREREIARYGPEIEDSDDPRHEAHKAFLSWAAAYDTGGLDMRSRALHEAWLRSLPTPILRLEGERSLDENLEVLCASLETL